MTSAPTMQRPPAVRQGPRQERKSEPVIPFAGIFRDCPEIPRTEVQAAIDALVLAKRSVSVLRVREYLDGVLPATDRPPVVVAQPVPQIVETVHVAGPPEEELQQQHIARVAALCAPRPADRLAAKLARCTARPALTEAQEAQHRRMTARWEDWQYSPRANAYAGEGCE